MQKLKDDIIRTYKNHKAIENNVSSDQRAFIKDLANNDSVIIKPSDKCKGFVILDKQEYIGKAKLILDDRSSYDCLDKKPSPSGGGQSQTHVVKYSEG